MTIIVKDSLKVKKIQCFWTLAGAIKYIKVIDKVSVNKINDKGVSFMFVMKIHKAGEYILMQNYTPKAFGAPSRSRKKKSKETPKAMAKYNNHKRAEKLQLLMIANFDKGFHVVLDYPKGNGPESYKAAEDNLKKMLYKVSRHLKKQNRQFKYIAITERGKLRAALHHHMIIEGDHDIVKEITSVWGSHIKFMQMYEEGAYKDLAEYFCKIETKEEQSKGKSKYHRSRNLIEPTTQTVLVAGQIKDEPFIPKGFELEPGTLKNGFNEVIGVRYQSYLLHKIPKPKPKSVLKGDIRKAIKKTFRALFGRKNE